MGWQSEHRKLISHTRVQSRWSLRLLQRSGGTEMEKGEKKIFEFIRQPETPSYSLYQKGREACSVHKINTDTKSKETEIKSDRCRESLKYWWGESTNEEKWTTTAWGDGVMEGRDGASQLEFFLWDRQSHSASLELMTGFSCKRLLIYWTAVQNVKTVPHKDLYHLVTLLASGSLLKLLLWYTNVYVMQMSAAK